MDRTLIAYSLIALLVVAGVLLGLYLRHNSRELTMRRRAAREKLQRETRAAAANR